MTTTPSALALTVIADGSLMVASDERNNYASIQTQFNALLTLLNGGTAAQFLQSGGGTTVSWAGGYTAYTPAWTSNGVAPALGNGTIVGSYVQVGKLVNGWLSLVMGSTTTFGTGSYIFTFPATPAGALPAGLALGSCGLVDTSGGVQYGLTAAIGGGGIVGVANSDALVGAASPFTFAVGDTLTLNFTYQAA